MTQKKPKTVKRHVKHASTTSDNHDSLIKAVIQNDMGEWGCPATGDKFYIDAVPKFPSIKFEIKTDVPPPYEWKWTIAWDAQVSGMRESARRGRKLKTFSHTGSFTSQYKMWIANLNDKILGGKLTVEVTAGSEKFRRTVFVLGNNPEKADVIAFISSLPNTIGFDKIIEQ